MFDHIAKYAAPSLLIILACGATTAVAKDAHYRWLNERGFTVYSDRPPPEGVDYEVVSSGSNLKRVVDGDTGAVPLEVEPSAGNEFQPKAKSAEEVTEQNSRLCNRARDNLEALSTGDIITLRDSNGEARQLTAKEVTVEQETARAQISVYCEE
ncbi:hypothetical protein GPB2148_1267 [marine gamma proteobacterium HTCC2148]|jgi:hypothetical protein|nr:hypothetical protein GPB2148_1267 [marine gamma proteobacterium HTCC2148]MBT6037817.1 DUF4124 domain-containing protein [Halieaceae bacterium]